MFLKSGIISKMKQKYFQNGKAWERRREYIEPVHRISFTKLALNSMTIPKHFTKTKILKRLACCGLDIFN